MSNPKIPPLSRRERQIMDIVYARKEVSAADVREHMPDKLSDSSVRTILRILCEKGHLKIRQDGPRYIYMPVLSANKASRSALRHVIKTFFDDSIEDAVVALLDMPKSDLSPEVRELISKKIEQRKKEGK